MKVRTVKIESSWKEFLQEEFNKEYFSELVAYIKTAKSQGKVVYPPGPLIFNAFNLTPVDKVKVVIIGQDPYHNPNEAMGLSFSVPHGVKIPPSLKNIYKELNSDLGISLPQHGNLTHWAEQGVLLLNAMLTVEHRSPGSHKNIGWQNFTDAVISNLSEKCQGLIFLLWGNFAKSKAGLINKNKHHILMAAHPSPLARGAFFGSKHFSQTNMLLREMGKTTIDWSIDD